MVAVAKVFMGILVPRSGLQVQVREDLHAGVLRGVLSVAEAYKAPADDGLRKVTQHTRVLPQQSVS